MLPDSIMLDNTDTEQYDYAPQQRQLTIIKYMKEHQGCTKSDIARGLKDVISKKPICRIVDEMIENKIVVVKKEKENSRNHKLYLKEDNLLVSVPLQLDEFETAFKTLFSNILQNIKNIRTSKFPDKTKEELSKIDDASFYTLLQCINILDKISNVYAVYSVIDWPDKEAKS